MSTQIQRDAEELVRYYSELVRRLGQGGVRDVADLLTLYEQLRRALEAVSQQEIDWATEQTGRLMASIGRLDAELQALGRLKKTLGELPPQPAGVEGESA